MTQKHESRASATIDVLVIDDDRANAELIARYINNSGFRAQVETNSFAGMNALRRLQPPVILLDIQMPGMDGIRATGLARTFSPGSRIILMSGYPNELSEAGQKAIGAFAILEKPLPLPAVLDFIRRAVA
ncbi:response regulator [Minwuia sp.]|uniref:response regulator n=1 Tax=Minwuia sp. TaxID=2493630 RepID=UPI003A950F60